MSIATILLILFVLALMISPIMMMRPSSGQSKLAALRAHALELGLKVKARQIDYQHENRTVMAYILPFITDKTASTALPEEAIDDLLELPEKDKTVYQPWRLVRQEFEHGLHFYGVWDWAGETRAEETIQKHLRQKLDNLPTSVIAIEGTNSSLACYWLEQGGLSVLSEIEKWLKALVSVCKNID